MSERWHDVFDAGTLREQGLTNVIVEGRDVALYAVDDEVFASDNRCTHGDARLSDGFLLGDEIECPLHQGRFSLRTGEPMCAPLQRPVRVFPVKIEGGRVFVSVDGDEQAVDVAVSACAQGCAEGR
ncbi:non-heme iron oxygenase ferredoxin subunit [Trinickia fusca]|uniref:Non-heme iron oxygenase ferredoxin subunit n=1 Tax=Trinickia fusca TaxID=2419777 RepID=A0A494X632_9BURK|nr:non-heme iron oxygenase ferredoxin subunit [Trinickia fusca]RKP43439.1 non-heme iron oxygenase ferredoxin subunit [Trinickia fusca]